MYLRESKQRRADGSVVTYLQLAENVWDAAKGRSQASIVHHCGCADVRRKRSGASGDWHLIYAWPYGDLYVLEAVWKRLGIDVIVRQQAGTRHLGFDVECALFALIANRACTPASKLYCHEQ